MSEITFSKKVSKKEKNSDKFPIWELENKIFDTKRSVEPFVGDEEYEEHYSSGFLDALSLVQDWIENLKEAEEEG